MRQLPGALLGSILAGAPLMGLLLGPVGCATQASTEKQTDPAASAKADEETFATGKKNLLPPELLDFKNIETLEMYDRELVVAVGQPLAEAIEQPIAFPHSTHVQKLGMDCQYCHSAARKGIHAGVPATQVCMGCHSLVSTEGRPELDKLKDYYAKGEEIPWVRVHDLPDFVYFSHKRHVVGGVQCRECHGEVQEMGVNQRVSTLEMGWCLDCHAQHDSIDRNYGVKAELRRAELKDCWTCHK